MAVQNLGPLIFPQPPTGGAAPAFANLIVMNSSAHKAAAIIRAPKTGTLDKFELRIGAVANNPDNGLRFSFQDIDPATGYPDGTQDQFRDVTGTLTANDWLVPGLMTSNGTDGGSKRSVTAGDLLGCVVEFVSFVAGDSVTMVVHDQTVGDTALLSGNFPYSAMFTTGWVESNKRLSIGLKYNDGSYANVAPLWAPYDVFAFSTYNSSSTPDERGMKFTLPVSLRVSGVWAWGDFDSDAELIVYDSGDSAVVTVTLDPQVRGTTVGSSGIYLVAPTTLTAGTYRLVLKPTTTSNLSLYDFSVKTAALMGAAELGTGWHYTERTDAGSWTDTTTKRPWMGLIVDGIDTTAAPQESTVVFVG